MIYSKLHLLTLGIPLDSSCVIVSCANMLEALAMITLYVITLLGLEDWDRWVAGDEENIIASIYGTVGILLAAYALNIAFSCVSLAGAWNGQPVLLIMAYIYLVVKIFCCIAGGSVVIFLDAGLIEGILTIALSVLQIYFVVVLIAAQLNMQREELNQSDNVQRPKRASTTTRKISLPSQILDDRDSDAPNYSPMPSIKNSPKAKKKVQNGPTTDDLPA